MRRSSLVQCLMAWAAVTAACGAFAQDAAAPPAGTTRKSAPVPQAREIRNAFQGRTETPRLKLLERMYRAGPAADQPETIAALSAGMDGRLALKTSDALDWQFVSLLAGYSSEEATNALLACLEATDWRIALTALRGLSESRRTVDWNTVSPVTQRTDYDKVYALRRATVALAEQVASPPAIEFLIGTVASADGQLKYEAAVSLTKLTGEEFGGRGEEWSVWWSTAHSNFAAVPLVNRKPVPIGPQRIAWNGPVPVFFGVPVYARRVVFIIDRSESMASSIRGESRLKRAQDELEHVIEVLPEGTEFNVIAYHDSTARFVPRLIAATRETKRQAIQFAESFRPDRHTACYDALVAGLQVDPNLEVIYFLSDGEPTTGQIVDPPSIVEAVTQLNRFQLTSMYTLGIDARGVHEEFLKRLAARNFGDFFPIR